MLQLVKQNLSFEVYSLKLNWKKTIDLIWNKCLYVSIQIFTEIPYFEVFLGRNKKLLFPIFFKCQEGL